MAGDVITSRTCHGVCISTVAVMASCLQHVQLKCKYVQRLSTASTWLYLHLFLYFFLPQLHGLLFFSRVSAIRKLKYDGTVIFSWLAAMWHAIMTEVTNWRLFTRCLTLQQCSNSDFQSTGKDIKNQEESQSWAANFVKKHIKVQVWIYRLVYTSSLNCS